MSQEPQDADERTGNTRWMLGCLFWVALGAAAVTVACRPSSPVEAVAIFLFAAVILIGVILVGGPAGVP